MVAAHGMELQDPSRRQTINERLATAGIAFESPMRGMIYLRTLRLEGKLSGLKANLSVINHDNDTPLAGVTVSCDVCGGPQMTTDASGQVSFDVPAGAVITFQATRESFNAQTLVLATPFTE